MKIAIVADDITGANDSGVQLARHGLKTAVLFDIDEKNVKNYEAVVYDTDSRSINKVEAYNKVKQVVLSLKNAGFTNIFKKLDSTMRGNIGAEIDAVYDVLIPDFVMIAPGYPKNNRTILNSVHYLNGVPLGESEIAKDPKTPVTVSSLTELLENQTAQRIETITVNDLALGKNHIEEMLKNSTMRKFHILLSIQLKKLIYSKYLMIRKIYLITLHGQDLLVLQIIFLLIMKFVKQHKLCTFLTMKVQF